MSKFVTWSYLSLIGVFLLKINVFAQNPLGLEKTFSSQVISFHISESYQQSFFNNQATETSASIGNLIWNDANKNGIQDFGEKGIAGVKVYLLSVENLNSISTVSDINGNYEFNNLSEGNYALVFNTPPGFQATEVDAGSNDNLDSDADKIDGTTTYTITLKADQNDTSWDAGFYSITTQQPKESKIIGMTWEDFNANGQKENIDLPLNASKVELLDALKQPVKDLSGNTIAPILTDAIGKYQFSNLKAGTYFLKFSVPIGFSSTAQNIGNDLTDSDANQTTGFSSEIILLENTIIQNIDAGFFKPSSIGNFVWEDLNGNGIQDLFDEKGISGVVIELFGTTNTDQVITQRAVSNSTGQYLFENLTPGKYTLTFTNPSSFKSTAQNQGINSNNSDINIIGKTTEIVLLSGETNINIDAGFFKPSSIGNFVWEDLNGNGIQDLFDEKGISGVVIDLFGVINSDQVITQRAVSNPTGQYLFEDLTPGIYTLTFTNPFSFKSTAQRLGINSNNSGFNAIDKTIEITLLSGEINTNIDAGFFKPASIGNFVWEDKNKNGYQEESEQGISNVIISLKGINGKGEAIEKQNTTNIEGKYQITDIDPGTYTITLTKPSNFKLTAKDFTVDDNLDSDIDSVSYQSQAFSLSSGQINNALDAGLYKQSIINGYLWNDANQNGIQDSGELPLSNIDLNISGNAGDSKAFAKSTVTNLEGKYIFYQIDPGFYNLSFVRPAAFLTSPKDVGIDNSKDSDVLNQTITDIIISSGETQTFDGGFYKPVEYGSIKGTVFNDINRNGLNDDESFIYQNQVFLLDSLGSKIAETQTDFNGKYIFDKLIGAKYQIQFILQAGKKTTISNIGLKDNIDSDAASNGKSPFVLIDTTKSINDSARDIQFVDVGIIPIEPFCEPFCIPFLINKDLIKRK